MSPNKLSKSFTISRLITFIIHKYIAFPLLAGPGAITAVIILYQTSGFLITVISIIIVLAITYVILRMVNPIYKVLGNVGSMIVSRVFAVIIAAIAVEYIVEGIKNLFVI